jgi:hypothetical protein
MYKEMYKASLDETAEQPIPTPSSSSSRSVSTEAENTKVHSNTDTQRSAHIPWHDQMSLRSSKISLWVFIMLQIISGGAATSCMCAAIKGEMDGQCSYAGWAVVWGLVWVFIVLFLPVSVILVNQASRKKKEALSMSY